MSAAAAAATRSPADDDGTLFFADAPPRPSGRQGGPATAEAPPRPPSDRSAGPTSFNTPAAFRAGPDDEPSAARLAARSEPLGGGEAGAVRSRPSGRKGAGPAAGRRPAGGKSSSSRRSSRRTPKEPSAILLGVGLGLVVLAGIAAAYFLTQGADAPVDSDQVAPIEDQTTVAPVDTTPSTVAEPVAAQAASVTFDEAAGGPIGAGNEYQIGVNGGPAGASYQLFVDGEAQADPAPQLPPTVFEPGRHLLEIAITSPEGQVTTDPVVVYAVGEIPPAGYRANLASVNIEEEGWAEAVRRFDEFVANGHPDLELMPSDWFPSLVPGHWNLFVDGFETRGEAVAYCEAAGLSVPDQCFAQEFDPNAPAAG